MITWGETLSKTDYQKSERNRAMQNIISIASARRASFCLGAQLVFSLVARDGCIFKVFVKRLNPPGLVSISLDWQKHVHPGITGVRR